MDVLAFNLNRQIWAALSGVIKEGIKYLHPANERKVHTIPRLHAAGVRYCVQIVHLKQRSQWPGYAFV
jgi:hypothetical protein